jgi:hypothetical protein
MIYQPTSTGFPEYKTGISGYEFEDYQKLGRMSKPEMTDSQKKQQALAETLYNQFMGADHNPILEKLIRHMYTNSLISQTQMEAYTRKEVRNRRR